MAKYSDNFNRDYDFYLKNIHEFVFYGTAHPKHTAIPDESGVSAKEAFYSIDSKGKNIPCREPELLNMILACKASVNFHIKMWADGRADATLPKNELIDMAVQYGFPNWVIDAIENQKRKIFARNLKAT